MTAVASSFSDKFASDIGRSMPVFRGTYVEALRECLQAQKPLLVYLHSDLHQDSDLFLRTVLASSELSQLVQSLGLLLWVGSAHEADGFEAATRFDATGYPYLGLLAPAPSSSVGGQAQYVRHWTSTGLTTAAEISSHVRSATLEFRSTTERARATVAARVRHRDLVDEQQRAYEEAVERDIARARETELAAQREAEAKERAEEEAELEAAISLSKTLDRDGIVEVCRQRLLGSPEPARGEGVATLRVQLPPNVKVERRFNATDELRLVRDFVIVTSADLKQDPILGADVPFNLSSAFPRKTFDAHSGGSKDLSVTLKDAGLAPQASLLVTIVNKST